MDKTYKGKVFGKEIGFKELDLAYGNLVVERETGRRFIIGNLAVEQEMDRRFIVDLGRVNNNTKFIDKANPIAIEVDPKTVKRCLLIK